MIKSLNIPASVLPLFPFYAFAMCALHRWINGHTCWWFFFLSFSASHKLSYIVWLRELRNIENRRMLLATASKLRIQIAQFTSLEDLTHFSQFINRNSRLSSWPFYTSLLFHQYRFWTPFGPRVRKTQRKSIKNVIDSTVQTIICHFGALAPSSDTNK